MPGAGGKNEFTMKVTRFGRLYKPRQA